MAAIAIEAVSDEATGQVFAEVYRDDGSDPVMRSAAAFSSKDDMIEQLLKMLQTHFPDHFPFLDDPTIGV